MISDNATSKKVERVCKSKEVQDSLVGRGVTWKYIVERAPCWGGFAERLVRGVNIFLKKFLVRVTLHYKELLTVIIEIEEIIHDKESVSCALSLSDLSNGRGICSRPNNQNYQITSTSISKRARSNKQILCQFMTRWRKEYLRNLHRNAQVNSKRQKKV